MRYNSMDALKQLWRLAYPDRELPPVKSELWKDMGWQGSDPSTDFSLLVELVLSGVILAGKPNSLAGVRFLELLSEEEMAFDNLYCVAFQMRDAQWLAKRAS
ncbi:hypothetical protein RHSIM_Rhsim03G0044800 [Rhododendron simsii]|uniref:ELMO domain-containing protein n=1 Tax=Rhododendron simsii TaxID=118357 RepID=A0A834HEY8_RHOSS|nr:hypothetical protein RHSIM_Rhsim03G0044800 [Rhododendron simsii]